MYSISDSGLDLIKKFELFEAEPYLDSVHVPTIGYGTTFYPNGVKVTMHDAIVTKEQATDYLKDYVNKIAIPAIHEHIEVSLNQNQVDALCSAIYNLGSGVIINTGLAKKINSSAPCAEIQIEFKKWCHAGGKILNALVKRRAKEAQLFCS